MLAGPAEVAARTLLGCHLTAGEVTVRLTEVEAYAGEADPASHAYRGRTRRNDVMYGPAGHAYVYFTYGMHWCLNVVCGQSGHASAVLLRAGTVVDGLDAARARRPAVRLDRDLARGPARLTAALGVDGSYYGRDLLDRSSGLWLRPSVSTVDLSTVRCGPRVGVTGGHDTPWRFWLDGEVSVSAYRRHEPRVRAGRSAPGTARRTTSAARPPGTTHRG